MWTLRICFAWFCNIPTISAESVNKKSINNLFVTSKNETTNSPIHEFKVLHKGQRAF